MPKTQTKRTPRRPKRPKKPKAVGVPGMIKKIFKSSDEFKAFKNKLKQD